MAENSNISWTHHTFNPVIGCTKVSAACDFCYAEDHANKWEPLVTWGKPGQKAKLRRTSPTNWKKPFSWDKTAKQTGIRTRVFCASLADVFDNDWDDETRRDLWDVISATRSLDWLLLTKRPQNVSEMLPKYYNDAGWWKNVWLGTTTENQTEFDRRWPLIKASRAGVHFISYEPALSPLSLANVPRNQMPSWVICGGESGPNRRPFNIEWAEQIKSQCEQFNIPFFFKQDSSHKPGIRGRASDALWACKQFPVTS